MKKRNERHTQKKKSIACLIAAKCTVQCPTDKLRGRTRPRGKHCERRRDRLITVYIVRPLRATHIFCEYVESESSKSCVDFYMTFFVTAAIIWHNATPPPHALQSVLDLGLQHNPLPFLPVCQFLFVVVFRPYSTSSVHLFRDIPLFLIR